MKFFHPFRLDAGNQSLLRGEERVPLTPKAFDVLRYLVDSAGRLVSQDELLEAVWPETYVNPEVLRKYILEIRKALGDKPDKPEFIETITKRGYRFVATVTEDDTPVPASQQPPDRKVSGTAAEPPDRPPSRPAWRGWAILACIGLLLVAGLGGYFWLGRSRPPSTYANETSLAVLPFADLSPGQDQEYFSDGLTEELISQLGRTNGLKIVARSSAFQFKGKNEDLRSVGKKLGVASILEGSIRKEGDRVRITAELIKADDGFQLWSESYDRQMTNIFATQDDIARSVTDALKVKLMTAGAQGNPTGSRSTTPEAYQAYLQSRYFNARGQDTEDLIKALSYADAATRLDPNYAPAWAQRAEGLQNLSSMALMDSEQGFRQARESAQKAIALDPKLASGYLSLGMVQINHDFDWKGADASLKKAAELAPASVDVVSLQAYLARTLGSVDESIELYKQAIALDPLRANLHLGLAYQLYLAGRFEEALTTLRRAQELNPQLASLHLTFGKIYLDQGQTQQAVDEMEKETSDWAKLSGAALAYYAAGRRHESDAALNKLIATHQKDAAYQIAEVYAYRGEKDKAFAWLDRSYRQHDPGTQELRTGRLVKSLRGDPRYAQLLEKMRLTM
jgi:TolB-like protein/DNA-binding winged helix-turn-helix (wHTH) protein/Flp pilus assembly protein TadD